MSLTDKAIRTGLYGLVFGLLLTVGFTFAPKAHAEYHFYTCADGLTEAGTASGCTGDDVFNFVGGAASYNDSPDTVFPVTASTDYYISLNASDANGTNERITFTGDDGTTNCNITATIMTSSLCSVGAIGANGYVIIRWDDAGTIENLCVTDTDGECEDPPPPPPATSTPSQFVPDPAGFMLGLVAIFMGIVGMIIWIALLFAL